MCEACRQQWVRWLDYQPPVPRWVQYPDPNGSKSYDIFKAKMQDARHLIRTQQALIKKHCLEGRCDTKKNLVSGDTNVTTN